MLSSDFFKLVRVWQIANQLRVNDKCAKEQRASPTPPPGLYGRANKNRLQFFDNWVRGKRSCEFAYCHALDLAQFGRSDILGVPKIASSSNWWCGGNGLTAQLPSVLLYTQFKMLRIEVQLCFKKIIQKEN